jgi:glycosyltransferase involved in cell wall biosynthesis
LVTRSLAFAAPGALTTPTGGFVYDRRIVAGLRALGWRVDVLDLGDGFPFPSAAARSRACAPLAALPTEQPVVIDGLALGALPEAAAQVRALIALVHHPLALESGLSSSASAALRASETEALACARRVIVTSPSTARLVVSEYGVPAERVTIVRPGNDRAAPARVHAEGPIEMLAVGAVVPRKGYDVLLAAVAMLLDLPWRLTIVGDLGRDANATARLRADIARFHLADRVALTGAVEADRLEALYAGSDIFVLASRFEGYGMAFTEAIAHGLPVVGTTGGAIPETVPGEASLLAPPEDIVAFSSAVRRLIENSSERCRLAAGARAAAARLPTWEQAAELFSRAVETDVPRGTSVGTVA